jgi:hypothetical protein
MAETIKNPYEAVVVPMPYGEYCAQPPVIVTNTRGNAGSEFNNISFLKVTGGYNLTSVDEFREIINTEIKELSLKTSIPRSLETIARKLSDIGFNVQYGCTIEGKHYINE